MKIGKNVSMAMATVAILLPMTVVVVAFLQIVSRDVRQGNEIALSSTAQALGDAMDRELLSQIQQIEILAASDELDHGDIAGFYRRMTQVARRKTDVWQNIAIVDPTGQVLAITGEPFGAALPRTARPDQLATVIRTARPDVYGVLPRGIVSPSPLVLVGVPVIRGGVVKYVLHVTILPQRLNDVFSRHKLPEGWIGSMLDPAMRIAARSQEADKFYGQTSTPSIAEHARGGAAHFFFATNLDGDRRFIYYQPLNLAGWSVFVGVPAEVVDGPSLKVRLFGGAAIFLALCASLMVAWFLSRSERRRREAEARRIEEIQAAAHQIDELSQLNQRVIEHSPVGISVYDAAGPCVIANAACASAVGVPAEDLLSTNFRELASWKDSGMLAAAEEVLVRKTTHHATLHLNTSFGRDIWAEVDLSPISILDRDHLLVVFRDVGEQRRAEEDLKQSEARLRKLSLAIEQNPNLIVITDRNGVIEYVNPSFCHRTGYSSAEAIGQNPRILKSDETPAELYPVLWSTILAGHEWRGEIRDRCKDGRTFWSSVVISPVFDDHGVITHFIAMHEDVSGRKLAEESTRQAREQAEMASRAKSEILANMSHELRTPLNAVIGYSEALLSGLFGSAPHPRFTEYINDIHESGLHLLDIINDILDVSAIDAGKIELHEERLHVGSVVEASIRLVAPRAEAAKVRMCDEVPSDLPRLLADPRRLKQILLNLLSNAVKFTPQGGAVTISARQSPAGEMRIMVSDTGIGMDEAGLAKALSLFGQVDSGLARANQGSGLGLPLTVGLVELHGGTLDISSEKGVGTTVTVTFPAMRVEGV